MHDHVDAQIGRRNRRKNLSRATGPIRHATNRKLRLVPLQAHAAHHDILHARRHLAGLGPRLVVQAGADFEADPKLFRKLDCARLHDLGARPGHLEQLVVGNLIDLARFGNSARITGVDAVDVGENLAIVRLQGGGERDRGRIRSAPA